MPCRSQSLLVLLGAAGALLSGGLEVRGAPVAPEPPAPRSHAEVMEALTERPGVLINIHSGLFPATWDLTLLGQKATPALRKALIGNTQADVRWRAAQVLTQLRDSSALPELHQAVTDWSPCVRHQSMQALGHVGNRFSVPHLRQRLRDTQETLANRIAATRALGAIGDASSETDLLKSFEEAKEEAALRREVASAIWELRRVLPRERLVSFFRGALDDKDPLVCRRAAVSLGELRDAGALPGLYALLKGPTPMLRNVAAYVIGRIGDPRAVPELERALDSVRSGRLLNNIAFALQRLGAPKLWEHLRRFLNHDQAFIRLNAAFTTGEMKLTQGVPILIRLLSDSSVAVRAQALVALAKIRDPRSIPEVERLLQGKGAEHRRLALRALMYLSREESHRRVFLSLSTRPQYRREAALALAARRDRRAAPLLYPIILRRQDSEAWKAARELDDPLLGQLLTAQVLKASGAGDVRWIAAPLRALGPAGVKPLARHLLGLLFGTWSRLDLRQPQWSGSLVAVIRALGHSEKPEMRRWLSPYTHHASHAVRVATRVALARLGDEGSLGVLVSMLRNASEHHRPYLAARLGELPLVRLRPALAKGLADPDPYIRLAMGAVLFYSGDVTNSRLREALRSSQGSLRDRAQYYLSRRMDAARHRQVRRLRDAEGDTQLKETLDRLLAHHRPLSSVFREFEPMEIVLH